MVSCDCLNLSINVDSVLNECIELDFTGVRIGESLFAEGYEQELRTAILKSSIKSAKVEKLPAFVASTPLNGWIVNRCLLCDTDIYASNIDFPDRIIIDPRHAKSSETLQLLRNSPTYSQAFDIVLPSNVDSTEGKGLILPPPLVHSINQVLAEKLRKERYALDERIQSFADSERAKFDQFQIKVRLDELTLLRCMSTKVSLANLTSLSGNFTDENDLTTLGIYDEPYVSGVPVSPVSLRSAGGGAHSPLGVDHFGAGDQFTMSSQILVPNDYAADESSDSDQFQKIAMGVARVEVADNPPADSSVPALCRSLPVDIPSRQSLARFGLNMVDAQIDDMTITEDGRRDFDMAASMQALSRGTLPRDNPENLFGDRPGRRRFKSAFDRPHLEPVPDTDAF